MLNDNMAEDLGGKPDHIWKNSRTFAHRFARMCFLRLHCGENHPVTAVERDLISMARSKLHESLLGHMKMAELIAVKGKLISYVRDAASQRAKSFEMDEKDLNKILRDIQSEKFEDLIPALH